MQEVVEFPRLVTDPGVVRLFFDEIGEHHEVVDQDLVHPANRLERMKIVLGRLRFDVRRLVREIRRRGMDELATAFEQFGERRLREPFDLDVRALAAQFVGDRHVAPGMAEPDGRGQVEDAPAPVDRPRPAATWAGRCELHDKVTDRLIDDDWLTRLRQMSRAGKGKVLAAGDLSEALTALVRLAAVAVAVDCQYRATHATEHGLRVLLASRGNRAGVVHDHRLGRDFHGPRNGVFVLLARVGSLSSSPKKNSA